MYVRTVPHIQENARVVGRVGAGETDQLRGRHHHGPAPGYGQLVAGGVELCFACGPGRCGLLGLVGVLFFLLFFSEGLVGWWRGGGGEREGGGVEREGGGLLTVQCDQLVADEIVAGREAGRDGVVVAVVVVEHQGGLVMVGCG
jgi:hypothetical protein